MHKPVRFGLYIFLAKNELTFLFGQVLTQRCWASSSAWRRCPDDWPKSFGWTGFCRSLLFEFHWLRYIPVYKIFDGNVVKEIMNHGIIFFPHWQGFAKRFSRADFSIFAQTCNCCQRSFYQLCLDICWHKATSSRGTGRQMMTSLDCLLFQGFSLYLLVGKLSNNMYRIRNQTKMLRGF